MNLRAVASTLLVISIPSWACSAVEPLLHETWNDGVSLYTSPLRLTMDDWPAGLAVTGLLGGSVALDRITRHNLMSYQSSGSATDLRRFGDVAQFAGPIAGGLFAVAGLTTHNDHEKRVSWDLIESFL